MKHPKPYLAISNSLNKVKCLGKIMSTKNIRLVSAIGLLLGILCCVSVCIIYINWSNKYNKSHPEVETPIKTLSIKVDENRREDLFAQLKEFSNKNQLEFILTFYTRDKENDTFLLEMYGEGLEISAFSKPIARTELDIRFFIQDPTRPPSKEKIEELYNDLKIYINQVPNVLIIEEK